jgi:hypothetical protein
LNQHFAPARSCSNGIERDAVSLCSAFRLMLRYLVAPLLSSDPSAACFWPLWGSSTMAAEGSCGRRVAGRPPSARLGSRPLNHAGVRVPARCQDAHVTHDLDAAVYP